MDPLEFRLQNAVTEGVLSVYGPRYRKIGFVETLEAARDHPHYSAPLGPWQGRGVASGYWFNFGGETTATVSINEDGTAVVMSGCPDIGGTRVALAQMAAEELGIDVYRIEPVVADTHSIGYNDMTGGSRVAFAVGIAVVDAARQLIEDMCTRASLIWDVPREEVEWVDGRAQSVTGGFGAPHPGGVGSRVGRHRGAAVGHHNRESPRGGSGVLHPDLRRPRSTRTPDW